MDHKVSLIKHFVLFCDVLQCVGAVCDHCLYQLKSSSLGLSDLTFPNNPLARALTLTHMDTPHLINLRCSDDIVGCQRMPPIALTDEWSLRGILGQEGCRDDEMPDVETKTQRKCEEGNVADCALDWEEA